MKKKFLSLILCTTLALASSITVNARSTDSSSFVDLNTTYNVSEGTMLISSYNIDNEHPGVLRYSKSKDKFILDINFNDCSVKPKTVHFNQNIDYCIAWIAANGNPSTGGSFFIDDCESGKYKKVRLKLSDFSDSFTEDGKLQYTDSKGNTHIGDLGKKTNPNGTYYDSFCIIKSGAAHTAVIPDKNGEAEFYISANPLHNVELIYQLNIGINNLGESTNIKFGDTNNSGYTDVNDVTQIQLALAGMVTLDNYGKFNADINADGVRDVQDVTDLQLALAKRAN